MILTLGLLILFLGGLLVSIAVPKLIIGRFGTVLHPRAHIRIFISGLGLLVVAILMIHWGRETGVGGSVPLGITLFFVGLLLILLGVWLGLWAPVSARNANNMILLILLGVGLIAGGILIMAGVGPTGSASSSACGIQSGDWDGMSSRRLGPFPFSGICLALFIFTNAMAMRNGLCLRRTIAVNGLLAVMLVFLYMTGSSVSPVW